MLMDYTSIVIPKAFQEEVLKREHLSHARTKKILLDLLPSTTGSTSR